ncbi:peroxiredoxin family protein [candidate division CSSED10-310 bacterium]|uniref:Peroxiredoxin family protein n=1 Tax=candidate division CSSED10-310 bacterium TaxID=2855610 RepID=A0ABV6Z2X6_UNCC1
MVQSLKTIRLMLCFSLGFLLLLSLISGVAAQELTVGTLAPALTGKDIQQQDFNLSRLKGKVVIVNFWASWCIPCRYELPFFAELHGEFKERGLEIVAINVDKDIAKAHQFMKKHKLPFTIVLDTDHALIPQYHPSAMPTSYILDHNGIIRYIHRGFHKKDQDIFRQELKTLLNKKEEA